MSTFTDKKQNDNSEPIKKEIDFLCKNLQFEKPMTKIKLKIIIQLLTKGTTVKEINEWLLEEAENYPEELSKKIISYSKSNSVYKLWHSYEKHNIFSATGKEDFLNALLKYAPCPWKVNLPFSEWDTYILSNYLKIKYPKKQENGEDVCPIAPRYLSSAISKYKKNYKKEVQFKELERITKGKIKKTFLLTMFFPPYYGKKNTSKAIFQLFSLSNESILPKSAAGNYQYNSKEDIIFTEIYSFLDQNYNLPKNSIILIFITKKTKHFLYTDFQCLEELPSKYQLILVDQDVFEEFFKNKYLFVQDINKARNLIWKYIYITQKNKNNVDSSFIHDIITTLISTDFDYGKKKS